MGKPLDYKLHVLGDLCLVIIEEILNIQKLTGMQEFLTVKVSPLCYDIRSEDHLSDDAAFSAGLSFLWLGEIEHYTNGLLRLA